MCFNFFGGKIGKNIIFNRIQNKNIISQEGYYLIDENSSNTNEIGNLYKMYYDPLLKENVLALVANIRGVKGIDAEE